MSYRSPAQRLFSTPATPYFSTNGVESVEELFLTSSELMNTPLTLKTFSVVLKTYLASSVSPAGLRQSESVQVLHGQSENSHKNKTFLTVAVLTLSELSLSVF